MVNEFDDFMRKREAEKEEQRTVAEDTEAQWDLLKSLTRSITAGKKIDEHEFGWTPYQEPSYHDDFLQLENVAAIFSRRQRTGSTTYGVTFARNASTLNGSFPDGQSRIARKLWSCAPKIDNGSFVWLVSELGQSYSPEQLSSKIAQELVRYHEEYVETYRSWHP
jgi:hypothetical protein